jgi:hypothetical protein
MNAQSMQSMVAGFDSEAFGSQAVFRVALQALSHPGHILTMPMDAQLPQSGHGAAAHTQGYCGVVRCHRGVHAHRRRHACARG